MILKPLHVQDKNDHFIIENYYKVKWGFADGFINLWKVNHCPLLKKAIDKYPYKKELYPDVKKPEKDEQHRFELLIAHWDVMIGKIEL